MFRVQYFKDSEETFRYDVLAGLQATNEVKRWVHDPHAPEQRQANVTLLTDNGLTGQLILVERNYKA